MSTVKIKPSQIWADGDKHFRVLRTTARAIYGQVRNGITGRFAAAEQKIPRATLLAEYRVA